MSAITNHSQNNFIVVDHINGYLLPGPDIFVGARAKPFFKVPFMNKGSQPTDDGNLLLTSAEKDDLIIKARRMRKMIWRF